MQGIADDFAWYHHYLDTLVWSAFGNNSTLTLYRTTQLTAQLFLVGPEPRGSFPFYGHPRCFALADASARWMPCGMCQLSHHVDPRIDSSRMYGVVGLSSWYVQAGGKGSLLLRALVMRTGVRSITGGYLTYLRGVG